MNSAPAGEAGVVGVEVAASSCVQVGHSVDDGIRMSCVAPARRCQQIPNTAM